MSEENNSAARFNKALKDLSSMISSIEPGKDILGIIKPFEELGNLAIEAGFPGILDISIALCAALEKREIISESDQSVLSSLLSAIINYVDSPESESYKELIINTLSKSEFSQYISEDEFSILRSVLDFTNIPTNTGHTELDLEVPIPADSVDPEMALQEKTETRDKSPSRDIKINPELPEELKEMLQIIQSELINIEDQIYKVKQSLLDKTGIQELNQLTDEVKVALEFFSDAVDSFDFNALASVTRHMHRNFNIGESSQADKFISDNETLLNLVFSYLEDPTRVELYEEIINYLKNTDWVVPYSKNELDDLKNLFSSKLIQSAPEKKSQKQEPATEEDTNLALPDDIAHDLLEAMLQELPDQIEELTSSIQRMQEGGTLEDINTAKRIAHTLKGAGNTVGIRGIATLTHKMEDILLILSKNVVMPSGYIMELLIRATDCLSAMSEYLLEIGDKPDDALEVLQDIINLTNDIDEKGLENVIDARSKTTSDKIPGKEEQKKSTVTDTKPTIRVPATFLDQILRMIGESITNSRQTQNKVQSAIEQLKNTHIFLDELRSFSSKIEEILDTKDLAGMTSGGQKSSSSFDSLEMDYFTDLHVYLHQLIEKSIDAEESNHQILEQLVSIDEKLLELSRLSTDIKDNVEKNKLVPISTHSSRLQRIVRQASKLTEKKVNLELSGVDILIDSDILNNLVDSLIHLLRNAVDHGIEDTEDRIQNNKADTGTIHLSFSEENNQINICCEDDGGGINLKSVRKKACDLGIINAEQILTDNELLGLLFHPDFSTRSETTQISGRGIGLNAVYSTINSLSGNINIKSSPGTGTKFHITLPSSQTTANAIIVGIGSHEFAISTRGIDQIIYHGHAEILSSKDKNTVSFDGSDYPAYEIESLLGMKYDRRVNNRKPPQIIFYNKTPDEKVAILVDRIISCEKILVRSMGKYVPKIPGLIGVSILANGNVSPVIDIVDLLLNKKDFVIKHYYSPFQEKHLPTALVVDDSLSARRSLAQNMKDIGYKVRTAHDGIEAFDIINNNKPNILLTDMEMPRMNGLELATHIRSISELSDIPIIMVTSRSSDIHQQEAKNAGINAYLTKPYSEDELVDVIKELDKRKS